jgi:hypothetical protein
MGWKWRKRRSEPKIEGVVGEVEAFLAGRYLSYLMEHRLPVPVWAWLNPLAHGTVEEIRQMASRDEWTLASYLAPLILDAAAREGISVASIQATRLIPLELELCRRAGTPWCPRRSQLSQLVSTALDGK